MVENGVIKLSSQLKCILMTHMNAIQHCMHTGTAVYDMMQLCKFLLLKLPRFTFKGSTNLLMRWH